MLDLQRDTIAGPYLPLIEPDAKAVRFEPLCQLAHARLVLRAMADEYVVFELFGHLNFCCCSSQRRRFSFVRCTPPNHWSTRLRAAKSARPSRTSIPVSVI